MTAQPDTVLLSRVVAGTAGTAGQLQLIGGSRAQLTDAEVRRFVSEAFSSADPGGKRVCVVMPDGTRSCPLPLCSAPSTKP